MRLLFAILIAFAVVACRPAAKTNPVAEKALPQDCSLPEVPQVRAHWQAFLAHDIPKVLAAYDPQAKIADAESLQAYYDGLVTRHATVLRISFAGACKAPEGVMSFYIQYSHHDDDNTDHSDFYVIGTNDQGLIEYRQ